mgnify:CR=1 FL=1
MTRRDETRRDTLGYSYLFLCETRHARLCPRSIDLFLRGSLYALGPRSYALMRRSLYDLGNSLYALKSRLYALARRRGGRGGAFVFIGIRINPTYKTEAS